MRERKKKGRRKSVRRMKKKDATRGKEKRRKKRTKRRVLKEDLKVLFRWRLLKSSVSVGPWRVAVVFLGNIFWRSLNFEPDTRVEVHVVPDVIDVLVSPFFCGH